MGYKKRPVSGVNHYRNVVPFSLQVKDWLPEDEKVVKFYKGDSYIILHAEYKKDPQGRLRKEVSIDNLNCLNNKMGLYNNFIRHLMPYTGKSQIPRSGVGQGGPLPSGQFGYLQINTLSFTSMHLKYHQTFKKAKREPPYCIAITLRAIKLNVLFQLKFFRLQTMTSISGLEKRPHRMSTEQLRTKQLNQTVK